MEFLLVFIEATLHVFASWTLAYHFSLLVHLPSGLIFIPFLAILIPLICIFLPKWKYAIIPPQDERWFLIGTVFLALLMGILPLFILNPNPDDYNFFHRALVQLYHLDQPFILTDTGHNLSELPPLSILHVMTSYEHFVAMTANFLGADPLMFYHNVSPLIAEIILTIVYILVYRQFGLNQKQSLAGTLFAFLFLFLDINFTHRSFGNIVIYLWIGKVILWGVLIPMTLLVAYRFMSDPTPRGFMLVSMTGISAVGLSGSGVFTIPILILGVSLAYLLTYGFSPIHLKSALWLNLASFYCFAIAVISILGLLPKPPDISVWTENWPSIWWQNLGLVISSFTILSRNILVLFILPFLAITTPLNRFFPFLTLGLCLIFANPVMGGFWLDVVQPAAYWRLAFLFPIPWCAGLMICSFIQPIMDKYRLTLLHVFSTIVAILILNIYYTSGMTPKFELKLPWEYRLPKPELAFAQSVRDSLHDRNILAPESLTVVLALIEPTLKFEATRGTLHNFVNGGQKAEGLRRIAAQNLVTTCSLTSENEAALVRSIQIGANGIIIKECELEKMIGIVKLINSRSQQWSEVERNNGYILILPQKT